MAKFNVGDEVVLARVLTGTTKYNIGDVRKITAVFDFGHFIDGVQDYDIDNCEIWQEDELELYVEDKKPEEVVVVDTANKEVKVGFVPKSEFDEVNKAAHYNQGKYEVIDVLRDWLGHEQFIGFLRGNVLKYVARYQQKGGIKDLQKAEYYNKKLIEEVGKQWK